jgi:hypothetical protein
MAPVLDPDPECDKHCGCGLMADDWFRDCHQTDDFECFVSVCTHGPIPNCGYQDVFIDHCHSPIVCQFCP